MFGFVLRLLSLGMVDGSGLALCCGGSICAICALFGLYRCSKLRMRDCSCIKWCMRATGTDEFDDFDLMVIAHEATFTSLSKKTTKVRLTAGIQQVQTNDSSKGIYQEALQISIEQGTPYLLIELMDGRTVLANLKVDILSGILKAAPVAEKEYRLHAKCKGITNPQVKLTMHNQSNADVEKSLLSEMNLSKKTEMLLHQQLLKDKERTTDEEVDSKPKSPVQTLAAALKGQLDMFGSLGSYSTVYVAVLGPPQQRKYCLSIFKDEKEYSRGARPTTEVDLLKVVSVQEDPSRPDVFHINFVDNRKNRERLAFRRLDLPTGTWVELISKLIKLIREERDMAKKDNNRR